MKKQQFGFGIESAFGSSQRKFLWKPKTIKSKFKKYVGLYRNFNTVGLIMALILAQYLGGVFAIVFAFFCTFGLILGLEKWLKIQIL